MYEPFYLDEDLANADWTKTTDDTRAGRRARMVAAGEIEPRISRVDTGPPTVTAPVDPESFLAAVDEPTTGGMRTMTKRLSKLRQSLGTRLLTDGEHAYDAALRQAGVRVQTRARSRLSSARSAQVATAVEHREPLKAWLSAVGITELELLRGSFDVLEARVALEFDNYWTRVQEVIRKAHLDPSVVTAQANPTGAVEYYVAGWTAMARRRLLMGDEATLAATAPRLAASRDPLSTPTPEDIKTTGARLMRNALRINEGAALGRLGATPDDMPEIADGGAPPLEVTVLLKNGVIEDVPARPTPLHSRHGAAGPVKPLPRKKPMTTAELKEDALRAAEKESKLLDELRRELTDRALKTEQLATTESPETLAERRARRERVAQMTEKQRANLFTQVEKLQTERAAREELAAFQPEHNAKWEWIHGFYGEPKTPFEPHELLDGTVVTGEDADVDERLLNDEAWPEDDFYYPGDHDSCTCDWLLLV